MAIRKKEEEEEKEGILVRCVRRFKKS